MWEYAPMGCLLRLYEFEKLLNGRAAAKVSTGKALVHLIINHGDD